MTDNKVTQLVYDNVGSEDDGQRSEIIEVLAINLLELGVVLLEQLLVSVSDGDSPEKTKNKLYTKTFRLVAKKLKAKKLTDG